MNSEKLINLLEMKKDGRLDYLWEFFFLNQCVHNFVTL